MNSKTEMNKLDLKNSSFFDMQVVKNIGAYTPDSVKPLAVSVLNIFKIAAQNIYGLKSSIRNSPVFILGNQKAGTSIVAALVGQATGCSTTLDLVREYLSDGKIYLKLKHGHINLEHLIQRNRLDFSREIIKEANLTPFYGDLISRFPESKYVFIIRNPFDNIRSQLNRLNLPGNLQYLSAEDIKKVKKSWRLLLDGSWLGLNGVNYIGMLAERWKYIADIYLNHKENMILIKYEDFLKCKQETIYDLAKKLNLYPKHDISDKINIQYQPKGNSNVNLTVFYGSRNIQLIENICYKNMKLLGYNSIRV